MARVGAGRAIRAKSTVVVFILLIAAFVQVCALDDTESLYLYALGEPLVPGTGLREHIRSLPDLGGTPTEISADAANSVDDFPNNVFDLGFSFPFYGSANVRNVGVSPDGLLSFSPYQVRSHPCKDWGNVLFWCLIFNFQDNAIGPWASDLSPGEKVSKADLASAERGSIYVLKHPNSGAFSAVWQDRRLSRSSSSLGFDPGNITFGATLRPDGRVSFYYGEIPTVRQVWIRNGQWTGARAPSWMNDVFERISTNDKKLQGEWINSTSIGRIVKPSTGYLTKYDDVTTNAVINMCMVPDRDLSTLSPVPICTQVSQKEVNTGSGERIATVRGPNAMLGCLKSGIALKCRFNNVTTLIDPNDTSNVTYVYNYVPQDSETGTTDIFVSNATLVSSDTVSCALPDQVVGLPGGDDWDALLPDLELAYVDVHSLFGASRIINTKVCDQVNGPTSIPNDPDCPAGQYKDCNQVCGGTHVLDRFNVCYNRSEINCYGSGGSTFLLADAPLPRNGERTINASDQLVCCSIDNIDCAGICQGCRECVADGTLPQEECPLTDAPTPTPVIKPYDPPPKEDENDGLGFSTVTWVAIGALIVMSLNFLFIQYQYRMDNWDLPERWANLRRASTARKKNLTAEEIEEYTKSFVYDEEKMTKEAFEKDTESPQRVSPTEVKRASQKRLSKAQQTNNAGKARRASRKRRASQTSQTSQTSHADESTPPIVEQHAESNKNVCAICICEFEFDEMCMRLPCKHVFHQDCATEWFQRSIRCPLCNGCVLPEDPEQDKESEGDDPASDTITNDQGESEGEAEENELTTITVVPETDRSE